MAKNDFKVGDVVYFKLSYFRFPHSEHGDSLECIAVGEIVDMIPPLLVSKKLWYVVKSGGHKQAYLASDLYRTAEEAFDAED